MMTKSKEKVENLYSDLPQNIKIIGKQVTKSYKVNWEREGTEEFAGSRFVFTIDEMPTEA